MRLDAAETKVRVTALDMGTGKSKSKTLYDTDPTEVITAFEQFIRLKEAVPEKLERLIAGLPKPSAA